MGKMFRLNNLKVLMVFCFIANTTLGISQAIGDFVIITDFSNELYGGTLTQNFGRYLTLMDSEGYEIEISDDEIRKIEVSTLEEYQNRQARIDSRRRNYFITSSAIGLRKQQYDYQNIGLRYNKISRGLTDYLMISAGLFPDFNKSVFRNNYSYIGLSVSLHTPVTNDIYVSFNSSFLSKFEIGDNILESDIFQTYLVKFTYGSPDKNFTLGAGFIGVGEIDNENIMASFSWKIPIYDSFYCFNENIYLGDEPEFFGTLGLAYQFRKMMFYGSLIFESEYSDFYPMFGASVIFGKK